MNPTAARSAAEKEKNRHLRTCKTYFSCTIRPLPHAACSAGWLNGEMQRCPLGTWHAIDPLVLATQLETNTQTSRGKRGGGGGSGCGFILTNILSYYI